jgi:hypothetical protein
MLVYHEDYSDNKGGLREKAGKKKEEFLKYEEDGGKVYIQLV